MGLFLLLLEQRVTYLYRQLYRLFTPNGFKGLQDGYQGDLFFGAKFAFNPLMAGLNPALSCPSAVRVGDNTGCRLYKPAI